MTAYPHFIYAHYIRFTSFGEPDVAVMSKLASRHTVVIVNNIHCSSGSLFDCNVLIV